MKRGKRVWALAIALCLVIGFIPVQLAHAAPEEVAAGMQLYVAPDGSDSAAGTIDAPLATLEGARDKIREIKKSGLPQGGITVNLREGVYARLENSFTLEEQDSGAEGSPIVYQAYPGETVEFVGSLDVKGSDFTAVSEETIWNRLPEAVRDEVRVYDITGKLGIEEFAPIIKNGFGWLAQTPAMSITVDGEAQTLARYPNEGWLGIHKIYDTGFINRDHLLYVNGICPQCTKENGNVETTCQYTAEERLNAEGGVWTTNNLASKYDLWSQESDIWTFGYFGYNWGDDNCPIEKVEVDGTGLMFTASQPSHYGVKKYGGHTQQYYAYNLLCEIDQPGEWYLDRDNGKLYLYPEKDLSSSTIRLSMMGKPFVKLTEVEYVQFKNLDFANANSHGIEMLDSSNILVAGCSFTDLGQLAVKVGEWYEDGEKFLRINEGARGGWNNIIQSCDILRTGQGGIYLAGGNRYTLTPSGHQVVNCTFDEYCVIKRTYSPAVWLFGVGSVVESNVIRNAPHMAIQIDGNNHKIRNNEIYNVCYEASDVGAIYTGRTASFRGTVIENNYIHDLVSNHGVGSAGVYVDDGASGVIVRNNLFRNLPGRGILCGGGLSNDIQNNIFLDCGIGISYDNRLEAGGAATEFLVAPYGQIYAEWKTLKEDSKLDDDAWAAAYPALWNIPIELAGNVWTAYKKPAGATIQNNLFAGVNNWDNINNSVKTNGTVQNNFNYAKGTDIGFTDAASGDFTVKPGSIIEENLQQNHFVMTGVGIYADAYRPQVGVEVEKPVLKAPSSGTEDINAVSGLNFSWGAAEGAASYSIHIAEDKAFETIVYAANVKATSAHVATLLPSKTYYWRVTALEGRFNGNRAVSDVWTFTTSDVTSVTLFEGFGNPEMPGWEQSDGTPTLTESPVHSGHFAYICDEERDFITKKFPTPQNEVISVWMYDDMGTGYYLMSVIRAQDSTSDDANVIFGLTQSDDYYMYRGVDRVNTSTNIRRTKGWHELKLDFTSGEDCKLYLDGILVNTRTDIVKFDSIDIGDLWGTDGSLPGGIGNVVFDDLRIGDPVIDAAPKSVTISETVCKLTVGDVPLQLTADAIMEPDVDPEGFKWGSSNSDVVSVSETGLLTAKKAGTSLVSVYIDGHEAVKATCTVTVEAPPHDHSYSTEWHHDETSHWKECTVCGDKQDEEAHQGGTATCSEKAVCKVCEASYGAVNPDNHVGGIEIRGAKEPTWFEDGYTGDTYCKDCGDLLEKGEVIPKKGGGITWIPSVPDTAPSWELPFTDVAEGAWYYESVYYAWDENLIDGVTPDQYQPDGSLTVAQAIKLAAALHENLNRGYVTLENGTVNWYDTYVDYAVNNDIIEAKYQSYTKAQMDAAITRNEFVHIFHGAMDGYKEINTVADNAIPDVKLTDAYADEIYEFYRAGILTGSDGAGTFNGKTTIKRSEVATILIRMFDDSLRENIAL